MKDQRRREDADPVPRPTNWTIIALVAGMVLLVIIIGYFAMGDSSNQDRLTNAQVSIATPQSHEKLCSSGTTFDLIKRALFKRAAELRGSDQSAFEEVAGAAVVRMEDPVMESEEPSTGAVNCSGSLSLDLPPGVVAGGRQTLMSDVDYTVQQATDGSGTVVVLHNADAIINPLSTLSRVEQPSTQPSAPATENGVAPETPQSNSAQPTSTPPQPTPAAPQPSAARAGFNCATSHTPTQATLCGDPGLASLDRGLASENARALGVASPDQRDLLRSTERRFDTFRDRCSDRKCIADSYAGRIREIRDIIEGRWQPPR